MQILCWIRALEHEYIRVHTTLLPGVFDFLPVGPKIQGRCAGVWMIRVK